MNFWRSTLAPEETFTPSVLASEKLVGADTVPPRISHPWFMVWPSGHHPRWLGPDNFEPVVAGSRRPDPKLFARKFSSQTGAELLDRIDAELLN